MLTMMADNNTTFSALNVPTPCRTCSTAINAISWSFGVTNEKSKIFSLKQMIEKKSNKNEKSNHSVLTPATVRTYTHSRRKKIGVSSIFRWYYFVIFLSYTIYNSFGKYFSSPTGNCFVASLEVDDDDDGDEDWHSLCFPINPFRYLSTPSHWILFSFYIILNR